MSGLCVIRWAALDSFASGHGQPIRAEEARSWVEKLNAEYPKIRHWVEPWPSPTHQDATEGA